MNKSIFSIFIILLFITNSFSQEEQMGAMKTKNGILLFYNYPDNPHTIDLEGTVNMDQYPSIGINNKAFQFTCNSIKGNGSDLKKTLEDYMAWELKYINEVLPSKINPEKEFLGVENNIMNFWYFKNPVVENAPKDITPYKMTFYLDWKTGNNVFRLVFPSFSGDVNEAKLFMLDLQKRVRYYTSKMDLSKLYDNVEMGKNFYTE